MTVTHPWPELPSLPLAPLTMQGPTSSSNWVIKGVVLCGEYPGNENHDQHTSNLMAHTSVGVTTYVCLQQERELKHFRPYIDDYREISKRLWGADTSAYYVNFPIEDGFTAPDDEKLLRFVEELIERIRDGEKLYIHCWAGRGRTGIVVGCLLGILYSISAKEALERTNLYFNQREICFGDSPEYYPQKMQVVRVIEMHKTKAAGNLETTPATLSVSLTST